MQHEWEEERRKRQGTREGPHLAREVEHAGVLVVKREHHARSLVQLKRGERRSEVLAVPELQRGRRQGQGER